MKRNKLVGKYLKRQGWIFLLLLLFAICFILVFALYHLSLEAVGYAALLCAVIGLVFLIVGYARFSQKHRVLADLQRSITISADQLPEPASLIEEEYQELIRVLREDSLAALSAHAREKTDMVDYYTVWVHQIKTPIAAMRLILQGKEEENTALLAELFKIEQYVEMALCYLRMNSDQTDFVLREYSLDDIVKQAVKKYAPLFIRQRLRLIFHPTEQRVLTDEKWLCFAVEQILSNALKYTRTGSITIGMEGEKLTITDTGIGIAPEDLPRVCEKGFTGYNGRTDKKATGIGLYLTKQILSKLGHGLTITSQLGKGTAAAIDLKTEHIGVE